MGKNKADTTSATEVDTATGTEAGESTENFTTGIGTPMEAASSVDGMANPSSDSTTSASPKESEAGPLDAGASAAPDASKSETGSGDAPSTDDMKKALKGEDADGEGPTHAGSDTPEKLVSNPADPDTGEAINKVETHSDKPLPLGAFDKKDDDKKDG